MSARAGTEYGSWKRAIAGILGVVALVLALPAALGASVGALSHPEIQVGGFPTGIALNSATDTIYVGNGNNGTLSLIDGKSCNAGNAHGCNRHVTAVTAGVDPIGVAVDRSTDTVYVANASGTVAVVDGRRCNSANTSGCHVEPVSVKVGVNPQFLAVDEQTHTIYVANSVSNTVSVIDGRRCNAAVTSGCRQVRASIPVGPAPFAVAVSEATHTVYVADLGAPKVAVIDTRACNARIVTGCRRRPASVTVGSFPGGIAVNAATNTIYVTGQASNDVSVIDGRHCNGTVRRGCSAAPPRIAAGIGARGIAINSVTDTIYVANTAANSVSVIDGSTCNAVVRSGCGQVAPVAPVGVSPRRVAVDPVTNTVYVTNAGSNSVTMLNGRTCDGSTHSGCPGTRIA